MLHVHVHDTYKHKYSQNLTHLQVSNEEPDQKRSRPCGGGAMGQLNWPDLVLTIPTTLSEFAEELRQTCENGQDMGTKNGAHRSY